MKGLVILLGVCCFTTLLAAGEGRCGTRSQRRYWQNVRAEISCVKPKLQLLQLPVPIGYDYVNPPVAMLHQCSGHRCPATRDQCVATKTRDRTLAVKAYTMNDYHGTCMDITVQEHHECGCNCTLRLSDCSQTQILNSDICKCVCRPEPREQCIQRMAEGQQVMWDYANCICQCDVNLECRTGEYWVPEVCGCVGMNQPGVSEENNQDAMF